MLATVCGLDIWAVELKIYTQIHYEQNDKQKKASS